MRFPDLTLEQATQFCEHVAAREPWMLSELASWMDQTGGPIEEMDASVGSLAPLAEWYLDLARADFLGLTDGVVPSTSPQPARGVLSEGLELARRSAVGGERLAHYVRLVLERLVPGTVWGVHNPRRVTDLHHQPAVLLPGWPSPWPGGGDWPVIFYQNMVHYARGAITRGVMDPAWLSHLVFVHAPQELVTRRQDQQPSVLTAYLEVDLPPMPDVARISPVVRWTDGPRPVPGSGTGSTDPTPQDADWENLILAKGPVEGLDDEPWRLAVLPADRVAAALSEGGFQGVDAAAVLRGGDLDEHPEGVAHVMTATHQGTLRALHIEPVDPTPQAWERLVAPLRMLAVELGANLVPEGEYPD